MMKEQETEAVIPEGYRWDDLLEQEGTDLKILSALITRIGE